MSSHFLPEPLVLDYAISTCVEGRAVESGENRLGATSPGGVDADGLTSGFRTARDSEGVPIRNTLRRIEMR